MHLNNGHRYPTQFMQIFGSASCVQQLIIPEWLNQIYIVKLAGLIDPSHRHFYSVGEWCHNKIYNIAE